jgi:transcriptional regulator with PAS, ATPase and Fis domain
VNVAALSETLLESELFGHEKGAFTGAIDSRRGLFELAQGGTIFLDEIGEMPLHTQTKLLRVLEEREFYRVGGEKPIRVDVRVIAATNQGLRRLVEVGEFRRDLYFRLNVLNIELPPLRDRRDDVKPLVEGFVEEASKRHDRRFAGISPEAMRILKDYDWPGNVRELKNLVESMVVLAHGRRIEARDIPEEVRNPRRKALLPAPIEYGGLPNRASGDASLRPELEFVFRTLMNLRMDVDDLRRDFDAYRRHLDISHAEEVPLLHPSKSPIPPALEEVFPLQWQSEDKWSEEGEVEPLDGDRWDESRVEPEPGWEQGLKEDSSAGTDWDAGAGSDSENVVVYRPGMTMDEIEEQAIRAALSEVDGNRRKAAERLGIGERTLYRKIKKFGLEE